MSTQPYLLGDGDADYRLHENAKERRPNCHIPKDAATDALAVSVNTGSLGGTDTLSIAPGPVVVAGQRFDIAQQSVGVDRGNSRPRRDVVFVTDAGTIDVLRGDPADRAWGPGVSDSQRTLGNSFLPAPRPMASTVGVPIAVVSVPGNNATSLADDSATVDTGVRPFERETFDLDESFANGDFQYRRLSDFGGLEEALTFSNNNNTPIYVDGKFTFSETNISLPTNTGLFGDWRTSQITIDTDTAGPLFTHDVGGAQRMYWSGIRFRNAGPSRAFIVSSGSSGFISPDTRWRDLRIEEFGATNTNPYTIDISDAYGSTFDNIHVWSKYRNTIGSFRFDNCNASQFRSLKFIGDPRDGSGDGETPVLYAVGCEGTAFYAPHIEHYKTDAVMQFHYGNVLVSGGHFEAHAGHHNAGIQIGDGGLTAGNTGGRTGPATTATVIAPTIHDANVTDPDTVRILNSESVALINVQGDDSGQLRVNYGGSNHDASPTTDLGDLTLFGCDNAEIVDNSGLAQPPITNLDGGFANRVPRENVTTTTSDYTASHGDIVFCDTSSSSMTVTLPTAGEGKRVSVAVTVTGGGDATVATPGSGTVDGAASDTISATGNRIYVCDGTDWWQVAN